MKTFERGLDPKQSMDIGIGKFWIPKISEIIIKVMGEPENKITLDTNLKDDLGIDSLDGIEIAMHIEQQFDLAIPDEEIAKVKTIGDIVHYLISKNNEYTNHINCCPHKGMR